MIYEVKRSFQCVSCLSDLFQESTLICLSTSVCLPAVPCYTLQVPPVSPFRTPEYAARMVFIAEASLVARGPKNKSEEESKLRLWVGWQDDPSASLQLLSHDCLPSTAAEGRAERAFNVRGEERETRGARRTRVECVAVKASFPRAAAHRCADGETREQQWSSGASAPCIYERGHVSPWWGRKTPMHHATRTIDSECFSSFHLHSRYLFCHTTI